MTNCSLLRSLSWHKLCSGPMSFSASYQYLPAGTLVRTCDINGKLINKWDCGTKCDLETASLALTIRAAATMNVPRQSIHLIWSPVKRTSPENINVDTEPLTKMKAKADVGLLLSPIEVCPESNFQFDVYSCFFCLDPCEDVDEMQASRTREENCNRCGPCSLCDNCRIQVTTIQEGRGTQRRIMAGAPRKVWVCFACLEPHEMNFLNEFQLRRFKLASPHLGDPALVDSEGDERGSDGR